MRKNENEKEWESEAYDFELRYPNEWPQCYFTAFLKRDEDFPILAGSKIARNNFLKTLMDSTFVREEKELCYSCRKMNMVFRVYLIGNKERRKKISSCDCWGSYGDDLLAYRF